MIAQNAITTLAISLYQSYLRETFYDRRERDAKNEKKKIEIQENEGYKTIKIHSFYFVYKTSLSFIV